MAILESVKELASKLGAETNGRDITDQLNKINKHLDETALSGRDIAEAVKTYSENASGGGGGESFEVEITLYRDDNSYTTTKTFAEISNALDSNKNVKCTATLINGEETATADSFGVRKSVDEYSQLNIITFAVGSGTCSLLNFIDTQGGVIIFNSIEFYPQT